MKGVDESWHRQQSGDFYAQVIAKRGIFHFYFVDNRGAAVNDEDQIFQIVAGLEVAVSAVSERLDFRAEEAGRGHDPDLQIVRQLVHGRVFHGGAIPTIGEPENLLIEWHNVEDRFRVNSPAQRCALAAVFGKAERAHAFAKRGVLRIRSDFGDCIHIQSGARCASAFIPNEQARDRLLPQTQVLPTWDAIAGQPRSAFQGLSSALASRSRWCSALSAIFRSRARPSRSASARTKSS